MTPETFTFPPEGTRFSLPKGLLVSFDTGRSLLFMFFPSVSCQTGIDDHHQIAIDLQEF